MTLTELVSLSKDVEKAHDELAKSVVAELLLISRVPETGTIDVDELIAAVLEDSQVIQEDIPSFDFAYWAQSTILEILDFLIACNALSGPSGGVDEILAGTVKRTRSTDDYIYELEDELEDYADDLGDICEF